MNTLTRRGVSRRVCLAATATVAVFPLAVMGAEPITAFPGKPITLIVPYAAGGSSDARARQVAQKMSIILGKPVIVENKPGGNGNIGTAAIAKAAADGYTIGIGNFAPLAVNKALFPKLAFDPISDLVPVVLLEKGPLVLVVSADKSPYKTLNDLLLAAKARPGAMSYASAGSGGAFHLAGEMLNVSGGVSAVHIPYRGGGPATNDLLGGTVDYMFDMVPAALGYLTSSPPKMRALAVANDKRLPSLPDVPTFAELGIKDMTISNWFGIVAPKGTPKPIVARLNQAVNQALLEPDLAQRITGPGNLVGGGSPESFGNFVSEESQRWGRLVKDKGIRPD